MKWLIIIGAVIWILGGIIAGIATMMPVISDGRSSMEESLWAIIAGSVCSCFGFVIAIVGLIMFLSNRSKAGAAAGA